jgi:hypothetical protein
MALLQMVRKLGEFALTKPLHRPAFENLLTLKQRSADDRHQVWRLLP